jgi:predicted nucleotidyltransferase
MTTDSVQRLMDHAAARDAWLDATTRQLQGDERVAAVWLVGSLGQGGGDEWSDVDLSRGQSNGVTLFPRLCRSAARELTHYDRPRSSSGRQR